jgi:AAA+ superfamily predicted ATPase
MIKNKDSWNINLGNRDNLISTIEIFNNFAFKVLQKYISCKFIISNHSSI